MKQSFTLLFFLLASCGCLNTLVLAKDCQLDHTFIEQANRVLFTHDKSGNSQLQLTDTVPGQQVLFVACIDKHHVEQIVCDSKTGRFMPTPPTSHCPAPKATVKVVDTFQGITEYSVGYQIDAKTYLEVYRTAYNKPAVSAVYILYDGVTGNIITERPDQTFTTDGVVTGKDVKSFQNKQIFQRFFKLYGPKQTYVKDAHSIIIDRGHLAPSADFLYPHDMRATFKYLNVVPQFSSINRGNWKTIETWVRSVPSSKTHELHVTYRVLAGALNVLKLVHSTNAKQLIPLFLEDGGKNPVPEWLYKVVDKRDKCTVFVTYNNIFATTKPKPICKEVKCPADIKLSSIPTMGYTYCCNVKEFKKQYLPDVDIC